MGDLRHYRAKRNPAATPEPFGNGSGDGGEEKAPRLLASGAARRFVVQQHAARRLHWDLRLEIGDVLVSWAVPRGPSLDPREKRLAVRTEDHPLEYADFEGTIPAGNYGAGAMIVWDCGTWQAVDGKTAEGLEAGKLDLLLRGHKLRGRFALVRTRGAEGKEGKEGKEWLLIRKGAPLDGPDVVESDPASVLSGLTVEEVAAEVRRDDEVRRGLRGVPTAEGPADPLRPMLASTEERPFSRDGWVFELKYDGARVLVEKEGEAVRVFARSGAERSAVYPEIARAAARLPLESFVLDGEVVALDEAGHSSFERLQRRFTQTDPGAVRRLLAEIPVQLYAFDLLRACGRDLTGLPLTKRKELLARFVPRLGVVGFADHVEGDGEALFAAAQEHGLEGIVAKRADAPYEAGRRSKRWLKIKVPRTATLAVVGITAGKGSRRELGSLMLAWRGEEGLVYAGNAGSGLDERSIGAVLTRVEELRVDAPGFTGAAPGSSEATFLRPELSCEARFTEVTSAGLLRHPVVLRVRDDLSPDAWDAVPSAHTEPSVPVPIAGAAAEPELTLTRLDKIFWPVEGYTKGDLLHWYEAVWPWLEPYLKDRPVVLTRYPDGIEGKHFYQQNAPDFTPEWASHELIDGTDYFICNDLRTLLYVINSGAIPLHVWSAKLDDLDHPDWLILDLDPKEAPFGDVVRIARHLHALLGELGVPHFAKTSGQDGLHVLLPLAGLLTHDESRSLAEVLARVVVADLPDIATVTRPVAARGDKVYVDYLQNGRGKLIVAPFSVRPRAGAPVSMPLTWRQVTTRLDPARFTIKSALARLRKVGDPFAAVLGDPVDVEALLSALGERLAGE